ncbi:hypothetical protein Ancab_001376 [Ancistrocladus abbreviatus]
MAGGGGGRSLEDTPTWAVAAVCFVLVLISIVIEYIIHLIGSWLRKRDKIALYEALEKIKSELMLLGFISLLLTVLQAPLSKICVSKSIAQSWHPCENDEAGISDDKCTKKGKVALMSTDAIHQLHVFIFVLALFHVLYCITTLALGRLKMKKWKSWENLTQSVEYQYMNDPQRIRFTRETTFGRRHLRFWSKSPILLWTVCFFRQFIRSVAKVDYLTLRHGFILAHLAPGSETKFDFQKYISRSLEQDFKVVVGISPIMWFFAVLFLLGYTHGAKLQVIITKMGLKIQERGDVIQGTPVVQTGDDLFWLNRPRLMLFLIHFVLFQNAFQLAFLVFTWYNYGVGSCFHKNREDIIIRTSMGVIIQFICSYVILPLYALVTQMGSSIKPAMFSERVAKALVGWHQSARKRLRQTESVPAFSSRPSTPSRGSSPLYLLHRHQENKGDASQASLPRSLEFENGHLDPEGSNFHGINIDEARDSQRQHDAVLDVEEQEGGIMQLPHAASVASKDNSEIEVSSSDFSFRKAS